MQLEAIVEEFAGQHRQLRHIGHAVHFQWQTDAVPVDGGGLRQLIDEAHTQPIALAAAQLQAGRLPAIGPRRRNVTGHQLDIQRRGDQFVIMGGDIDRATEQVAHATAGQTDNTEAGQASEHLSTGKTHEKTCSCTTKMAHQGVEN